MDTQKKTVNLYQVEEADMQKLHSLLGDAKFDTTKEAFPLLEWITQIAAKGILPVTLMPEPEKEKAVPALKKNQ